MAYAHANGNCYSDRPIGWRLTPWSLLLGFRSRGAIHLDGVYSLVRIPVPFIKLVYRYALFKAKFLNGEVVRKALTLV